MLSAEALKYLQPLKHDPTAERLSCMLPMGGIYWADEIPDFPALMRVPEQDRNLIFQLFRIRFKLWAGEDLDNDDRSYWDTARSQVPDYPVFHRVHISDEDRVAQAAFEIETLNAFKAFFADADDVTINADGSFSATFDLTKGKRPTLWQRVLGWCRKT
jgi:hypothetical protein